MPTVLLRFLVVAILGVAFSSRGLLGQQRREPFPTVRGSVRGQDGKPLANIWVGSRYFGDGTDSSGQFEVWIDTLPDTLTITGRGYVSVARPVIVQGGKARPINFVLVSAPAPCCSLSGRWSGRFVLQKRGALGAAPVDTVAPGDL